MAHKALITVIEDEEALATLLKYNLEAEGYDVRIVMDGEEALYDVQDHLPDLILLDWMLPNVAGIEICRQLRQRPASKSVPIIMLTARGEEDERIRGLNVGADDYIVKPFSLPELMARVKALLRRANPSAVAECLEAGAIRLDRAQHKVFRNGEEIHLGPTEFRLLEFLMSQPQRVFSRAQLLDHVWGTENYIDDRTVDVHIRRLRVAVNREGEDLIRTVRGTGYAFEPLRL